MVPSLPLVEPQKGLILSIALTLGMIQKDSLFGKRER